MSLADLLKGQRQRGNSKISSDGLILEIVLSERQTANIPSWKKDTLIPVHRDIREFFPGYKVAFTLQTDIGNIETHVSSRSKKSAKLGDMTEGSYIDAQMGEWFRRHHDLQPGDSLFIKKLDAGKMIYQLDFKKKT